MEISLRSASVRRTLTAPPPSSCRKPLLRQRARVSFERKIAAAAVPPLPLPFPMTIRIFARRSVLFLAVSGSCAAAWCAPKDDIAAVRTHWEVWEMAGMPAGSTAKASVLLSSQQADGCWADVEYSDQHVSQWRASVHLERLNLLASASYEARHNGSPNAALDAAAVHALRCWLGKDLHNPNWWWNEIGAPKAIGRAAVLLSPGLTADDIERVTKVLLRANWSRWTGQNLVWGADIELMRGLLQNDPALVREAFDRMYQEIRIVPLWKADGKPGEGIEADGSFHQHGAQLYSGGYGLSFAHDVGRELVLSWGTAFQAPPATVEVFSHFLLDGEQWMMRRGVMDYVTRGREITRDEKGRNPEFVRMVQSLAALPLPRQAEYRSFAAALADDSAEVVGNRAFWDSDYMVHRGPGYATSVRMLSTRSKNEESLNGEGMRSVHLADGANLLYKNGQEYAGIFPVWDWNLVPGTTALQWTSANGVPVTGEQQPIAQMGKSAFAGEVSDGDYGAAAMLLERGPLTAKKAWFFFGHLYVALGAGIQVAKRTDAPAVPVVTTVEQNRLEGDVAQQKTKDGRLLVAHHDVGYVLSRDAKAELRSASQTGRWSDIGTGPDTPISIPVFRLTLDHGPRPTDASYAYTVLPEGGMKAASAEAASPTVGVLANSGDVQAVVRTNGTLVMAVFYTAGALQTPMGMLRVDAPAMLLLRRNGGVTSVTASNPLGAEGVLHVTLNGVATEFTLPGGMDAGRSITKHLAR